jgi:hypothetical protein
VASNRVFAGPGNNAQWSLVEGVAALCRAGTDAGDH